MADYISCDRCDFKIGDGIDGRYIVDKPLGEGTFGIVFRVKDTSGNHYALKLLKLWKVESQERRKLLKRFDLEYETGQIPSNYLVHSRDKGMVNGNPYILMDYCPGGDLLQVMESSSIDLIKIAHEVLYGLRDLHQCGKVHRDLKPENVLLKQDGTAVLTDFGISGDQNKRMTERGIMGTPKQIFGTYGYMPPEQINPKRGDATVLPTTDIFSFGVMMYQLLTGKMPFGSLAHEKDLMPYVQNGKDGNWNRFLLQESCVGKLWSPLIEGCLIPDFKKRLQNIDAVLALLPDQSGHKETYHSVNSSITSPNMQIKKGVQFRIMQGEEYGKVYKLEEFLCDNRRIITIGRNDGDIRNVIAIKEEESCYISRKHCTLELDYGLGGWIIRDGQWERTATNGWRLSMNGTYVNSTEVTMNGMRIVPGDIVSIGDVKLRVEGY